MCRQSPASPPLLFYITFFLSFSFLFHPGSQWTLLEVKRVRNCCDIQFDFREVRFCGGVFHFFSFFANFSYLEVGLGFGPLFLSLSVFFWNPRHSPMPDRIMGKKAIKMSKACTKGESEKKSAKKKATAGLSFISFLWPLLLLLFAF